ncbi:MAG: hypothetical protein P4L51_22615, partial [Puia sp.]|nr:hypothetical protein [Puia sp.]
GCNDLLHQCGIGLMGHSVHILPDIFFLTKLNRADKVGFFEISVKSDSTFPVGSYPEPKFPVGSYSEPKFPGRKTSYRNYDAKSRQRDEILHDRGLRVSADSIFPVGKTSYRKFDAKSYQRDEILHDREVMASKLRLLRLFILVKNEVLEEV